MNHHQKVTVIEGEVERTRSALASLKSATYAADVKSSWADLLVYYRRSVEKSERFVATVIKDEARAKEMRGRWKGGDEGVTYLWEARNADDHGLTTPFGLMSAALSIGHGIGRSSSNLVEVDENSSVSIGYIRINGKEVARGITIKNGCMKADFSDGLTTKLTAAQVVLKDIVSEQKQGRKFRIPSSLNGVQLKKGNALALADAALVHLDQLLGELEAMI